MSGFFVRAWELLDKAHTFKQKVVLAAPPGDGKSTVAEEYALDQGGSKVPGKTAVSVLYVALPKGGQVNDRAVRWAIEGALGVALDDSIKPSKDEPKDDAQRVAEKLLSAGVDMLIIDDVQACNIKAFNLIRGVIDVYKKLKRPLALVLFMAQVTPRAEHSAPWPLLAGQDGDAWQMWRRLTAPRRPISIPGHDRHETGVVLQSFQELYSDILPRVDFARWVDVIFSGVTHSRVDRTRSGRASMDSIKYVALGALQDAWSSFRRDVHASAIGRAIHELKRL